jgi:histidinol-phosphate aminotransferase
MDGGTMSTRPLQIQPVPVLDELTTYTTGRPSDGIDLILDFNERLTTPDALAGRADVTAWHVNRYPELGALEPLIAARLGIATESVLVTGGADDALERSVRSVCTAGRNAIMTTPSYGMIRRFVRIAGSELVEIPWWRGDYPVEEVLDTADSSTALVCVVSPNNPTGSVASRDGFRRLVEGLPGTLVLLDQAYVDFTDPEHDLAPLALDYPNVIIVRTLSKAWGGAGLRVGYALGDPRVVDWLRRIGLPFPVSAPSLALATAMLGDDDGPGSAFVSAIRRQREELTGLLIELGAEAVPSQGSFVFARFPDARRVWQSLHALGIAVRTFHARPETEGWLRITLPGDETEFARLVHALRTVLAPEALLFDMDGVLVDVSGSYRKATLQTAASFGVELTPGDIERATARGNCNNDWELTRRLMAATGLEKSLEEVTARFEEIYQGTETQPGLRRSEELLLDRDELRSLADRLPLAVVTGRPRSDAERLLSENGLTDCFQSIVTMEDGPLKPDPAPVRKALDQLQVETAWMVGDTPDDLRAARGANVLPFGVVAPGDDPEKTRSSLLGAGAAVVLLSTRGILEMLP